MAGIRTSAVWVIGTATLATPIGQTSLGNYIFTGLQTQNWVFVMFGCVAAAAAGAGRRSVACADAGRRHPRAAVHGRRPVALRPCCVDARRACPGLGAAASRLCHRRKDLHRAIHPRRADRAAPAGGGADRRAPAGTGLQRPVRCACRRTRSISRWIIPGPSGPTACSAATRHPATQVLVGTRRAG